MHDECIHGLTPVTCAYCTGSWRREQEQLQREQRMMLGRINKQRAQAARAGTVKRDGWTRDGAL